MTFLTNFVHCRVNIKCCSHWPAYGIPVWQSARKKWRYDFKPTKEAPVYYTGAYHLTSSPAGSIKYDWLQKTIKQQRQHHQSQTTWHVFYWHTVKQNKRTYIKLIKWFAEQTTDHSRRGKTAWAESHKQYTTAYTLQSQVLANTVSNLLQINKIQ